MLIKIPEELILCLVAIWRQDRSFTVCVLKAHGTFEENQQTHSSSLGKAQVDGSLFRVSLLNPCSPTTLPTWD